MADFTIRFINGTDLVVSGPSFQKAIEGAYLYGAYLYGAYLYGANLYGANLECAKGLHFQIPQEGALIVFKKTTAGVVKLCIPAEAKRTATPIGRKCRAEFAKVLEAPKDAWDQHSGTV